MSETEEDTESRASPDGDGEENDFSYFQELEEAFIRLRGAPLLLSPADWQMAKEWRQRGIPVDLVERVLGEVLEERRSRPGAERIVTLRYFRRPVENAWNALGAMRASGVRGEGEIFDTGARLEQLAASLPSEFPDSEGLRRTLLDLDGDPEKVEATLTRIEDALLERLEADLDEAENRKIDSSIDKTLSTLATTVDAKEIESVRGRLKREAVRRHFELPVLSLFAVRE